MININIICIGKLKEQFLRDACAEYLKRLNSFCKISITELSAGKINDNPSPAEIESTLKEEGKKILEKVGSGEYVISMCIEGKQLSSRELAQTIENITLNHSGKIDFIIGGSYGLSEEVKNRSDLRLSMSKMTFPHQLARIMLLEQIYRQFMISNGGKYHK